MHTNLWYSWGVGNAQRPVECDEGMGGEVGGEGVVLQLDDGLRWVGLGEEVVLASRRDGGREGGGVLVLQLGDGLRWGWAMRFRDPGSFSRLPWK